MARKYTNELGMPPVVAAVIKNDKYSRGDADISVTELLKPPKIALMERLYRDSITTDISMIFPAFLGTAVHSVFENHYKDKPGVITETRMYKKFNNLMISGQFDLYFENEEVLNEEDLKIIGMEEMRIPEKTLGDVKLTSSFNKGKVEWEQQLNIYAYLFKHHDRYEGDAIDGLEVKNLRIIALYKDWRLSSGKPCSKVVEIPLWSEERQLEFILNKINQITSLSKALKEATPGDEQSVLPKCTNEDRWLRGGKYIRCKDWCSVSEFCEQWNGGNV